MSKLDQFSAYHTRYTPRSHTGLLDTIREQKEEIDRLKLLAERDELTGLRNYNSWRNTLDILKDSKDEAIIIVSLDVDLLKPTNDIFHHEAGDETLKNVARVLRSIFRDEDTFRKGGDEFVVTLPRGIGELQKAYKQYLEEHSRHMTDQELEEMTISKYVEIEINSRLKSAIDEFNKEQLMHEIPVIISYGTALSEPDQNKNPPHDIDKTFKDADNKMYQMKNGPTTPSNI